MGSHAHPADRHRESNRPVRWPTAQSRAEDVFLAWVLGLPDDADIALAAKVEVARLDRSAPLPPGAERLREFLVEATRFSPRRTGRGLRNLARQIQ
jgi:hypothetical protein